MPDVAEKPPKLTAELVDAYLAEEEKLKAAKAALKPTADKSSELYKQIHAAMLACGKISRKVGPHQLRLVTKKGSVGWKTELVKRLSSEELAAIEAAAPTTTAVEIDAA